MRYLRLQCLGRTFNKLKTILSTNLGLLFINGKWYQVLLEKNVTSREVCNKTLVGKENLDSFGLKVTGLDD